MTACKELLLTYGTDDDQPGGSLSLYFGQLVPDIAYDSSGTMGVNMCNPHNAQGSALVRAGGITWADAGLIMMCGSEFNGATLASRIASQGGLAVGTTLDSLQIAGASFLHEMMHFIQQGSEYFSILIGYWINGCII